MIVEYLDELAGGGKLIPASGPTRWKVKSDHSLLQGMLDSMLLCRYEKMVRPQGLQWQAWSDDHWNRAWQGMARFDKQADVLSRPLDIVQIALVCVLGYADFRFADCGWRKAYPNLDAFHEKMLARPSVKDLAAAAGMTWDAHMTLKFAVGDLTIHRIIEQETTFLPALDLLPGLTPERTGREPVVDAAGVRARRRGRADPVFPVLHREDAASHHSGRQLHRQRQAAAAAPEMEYENRRYLYARLRRGGFFASSDIDFVMCTHLHVDHVGWNTRLENGRWVPTFPNARYIFAKNEFDYWTEQNAKAPVPPFGDSVLPVVEANMAEIVRDDYQIGDHARILPTPGHTPGHVAFTFGRGKDDAVISGDLMHSPLQTRYPELSAKFDVDQAQAATTRRNFLERYCDTDTLCCTAHFPSPSAGKIRRRGDGFSCEPVAAS